MTTIACDGKSMAGDGQREMRGTIVHLNAAKIRKLADGRVIGTAGDTAFGLAVIDWLDGKGEKPSTKPEDGFSALVLAPNGEVTIIDSHCAELPVETPIAVGSGMDFAIGAMEAGKTPEEAVAVAAKRDPGTGGMITVLRSTIRAVA